MSELKNVKYAYVEDSEFVGTLAENTKPGFVTFEPLDSATLERVQAQHPNGVYLFNGRGNIHTDAVADSHVGALRLWAEAHDNEVSSIVDDLNSLSSIENAVKYVSKLDFSNEGGTAAYEAVDKFLNKD